MTIQGQMLLSLSRKEVSPHYICMGVTDAVIRTVNDSCESKPTIYILHTPQFPLLFAGRSGSSKQKVLILYRQLPELFAVDRSSATVVPAPICCCARLCLSIVGKLRECFIDLPQRSVVGALRS